MKISTLAEASDDLVLTILGYDCEDKFWLIHRHSALLIGIQGRLHLIHSLFVAVTAYSKEMEIRQLL